MLRVEWCQLLQFYTTVVSHLGIEKVHKILTLQRIPREMLALLKKKQTKVKSCWSSMVVALGVMVGQ